MSRIFDIELSCGCLFSSYGDYCIPCYDDENCKSKEEYYDKKKKEKEDWKLK